MIMNKIKVRLFYALICIVMALGMMVLLESIKTDSYSNSSTMNSINDTTEEIIRIESADSVREVNALLAKIDQSRYYVEVQYTGTNNADHFILVIRERL